MRIGIIGPSDTVNKVTEVCLEFSGVEAVPLVYQDPVEVTGIVNSRQGEMQGLFFCGPVPYLIATQGIQREIPWSYLVFESTGLLLALFRAVSGMPQILARGFRFSVDTLASVEVEEILRETGLAVGALYTRDLLPGVDLKRDFAEFHRNLYREGKTDFCISCVRVVVESLGRDGVPCFSVTPASQTIRGGLQRLLLEIRNSQKDYMRPVVGLVCPAARPGKGRIPQEGLQALHRTLLAYGEKRNILVVAREDECFQLVENYGQLFTETDGLKKNPLRKALLEATGLDVGLGYGVGHSLGISGAYAEKALDLGLADPSGACFLCDGFEARILGESPVGSSINLVTDPVPALDRSGKLRMTPAAVSRYLRAIEMIGEVFSAADLARQLGISVKGSRKILSAFLSAKIVASSGRRAYPGKGRPERLFRFSGKGGEKTCSIS